MESSVVGALGVSNDMHVLIDSTNNEIRVSLSLYDEQRKQPPRYRLIHTLPIDANLSTNANAYFTKQDIMELSQHISSVIITNLHTPMLNLPECNTTGVVKLTQFNLWDITTHMGDPLKCIVYAIGEEMIACADVFYTLPQA